MGKTPIPVCVDCGKEIINAKHSDRILCDVCRGERKKIYMSKYQKVRYLLKG